MIHLYPTPNPARYVAPIPGVPESQTRALDRRLKLRRQLQAFRGVSGSEPKMETEDKTGRLGREPA
jgi:hypothetical protein